MKKFRKKKNEPINNNEVTSIDTDKEKDFDTSVTIYIDKEKYDKGFEMGLNDGKNNYNFNPIDSEYSFKTGYEDGYLLGSIKNKNINIRKPKDNEEYFSLPEEIAKSEYALKDENADINYVFLKNIGDMLIKDSDEPKKRSK